MEHVVLHAVTSPELAIDCVCQQFSSLNFRMDHYFISSSVELNNPGHENNPGFPPLVSYAVGNAVCDAINNAVDDAVGNAIDILTHDVVVD